MSKHNKETCQVCTINKMVRECQADERQMKVINALYDAWENDSNDKAMYHSQVQELKIRVERLGAKVKELDNSLSDAMVDIEALEAKVKELEADKAFWKDKARGLLEQVYGNHPTPNYDNMRKCWEQWEKEQNNG